MSYALGAKEVQETILMLNLSVAQIELSINEGDHSVNTLIDSFTYMSQHLEAIEDSSQKIAHLTDQVDGIAEHNASLLLQTNELSEKMHQAIIAFQFYDKLSQRLNHVSKGLSGLAEIVSHEMHAQDQAQWQAFKKQVRQGTTMEEEAELFDLIFDQAMPVDQAIDTMKKRIKERLNTPQPEEDPIEFF